MTCTGMQSCHDMPARNDNSGATVRGIYDMQHTPQPCPDRVPPYPYCISIASFPDLPKPCPNHAPYLYHIYIVSFSDFPLNGLAVPQTCPNHAPYIYCISIVSFLDQPQLSPAPTVPQPIPNRFPTFHRAPTLPQANQGPCPNQAPTTLRQVQDGRSRGRQIEARWFKFISGWTVDRVKQNRVVARSRILILDLPKVSITAT